MVYIGVLFRLLALSLLFSRCGLSVKALWCRCYTKAHFYQLTAKSIQEKHPQQNIDKGEIYFGIYLGQTFFLVANIWASASSLTPTVVAVFGVLHIAVVIVLHTGKVSVMHNWAAQLIALFSTLTPL